MCERERQRETLRECVREKEERERVSERAQMRERHTAIGSGCLSESETPSVPHVQHLDVIATNDPAPQEFEWTLCHHPPIPVVKNAFL